MIKTEILLINPPFSRPDDIVIGIPVLAAYLRSKSITIAAEDLSLAFFRRTITAIAFIEGNKHAVERFKELNDKSKLDLCEMYEYSWLSDFIVHVSAYQRVYNRLLEDRESFWENFKRQNDVIKSYIISISTCQGFPEFFLQTGSSLFSWHSPYNQFSSADILESLNTRTYYTDILSTLITECLDRHSPMIAGISISYYNQILPAFYCAKRIKEISPHVHVIMGGSAVQIFFRQIENRKLFDVVDTIVYGDGEIPLERLSNQLSRKAGEPDSLPGAIYRKGDVIITDRLQKTIPVDEITCPDYRIFPLAEYSAPEEEIRFPVRLSRGCYWNKCSFCRTKLPLISSYHIPSLNYLFSMLDIFFKTTGAERIHFTDESINPEAMEDISRFMIDRRIAIDWNFQTRIHKSISRKTCELYRKAGCSGISFGVESFCDRLLKLMNKGITSELVEKVLREIKGILPVTIFMMVGFPSETEEEARETFNKVKKLKQEGFIDKFIYSQFIIHSGSDILENPEKYGIIELMPDKREDLKSDIRTYRCEGMSREKMRELYLEFSGLENSKLYPAFIETSQETIELRFELDKIRKIIFHEASKKTSLPFYRLITSKGAEIRSMKEKTL